MRFQYVPKEPKRDCVELQNQTELMHFNRALTFPIGLPVKRLGPLLLLTVHDKIRVYLLIMCLCYNICVSLFVTFVQSLVKLTL